MAQDKILPERSAGEYLNEDGYTRNETEFLPKRGAGENSPFKSPEKTGAKKMNEERIISVYDITVLDDFDAVASAARLLLVYMQLRDECNKIKISKSALSSELGAGYRTVTDWINKLRRGGAIKYKYSGETILNPFFYYYGTETNFNRAKTEWGVFPT